MKKSPKVTGSKRAKKAARYASRGAAASETGGRSAKERPVRKNYYLHQSKIDMVRELLNAKTETEAVDGALDVLIYGEALARGTESMAGEEYHDVLGIADEVPDEKA